MSSTATIQSPNVYKGIVVNNVFVAIAPNPPVPEGKIEHPPAYKGIVPEPVVYNASIPAQPAYRGIAQGVTIVYQSGGSSTTYAAAVLVYTGSQLTQKLLYTDTAATQLLQAISYAYDGTGRLMSITTVPVSGPTTIRSFTYNGSGQLSQIINS